MKTAKRRREVIQLREAGATWKATSDTMEQRHGLDKLPSGWDERYAYNDWKRELEKIRDETHEATKEVREMEVRRIDRMLRGVWQKAIGGEDVTWRQQKEAIDRVVKLQKRRAKLTGVDAPKRHQHGGDPESPPIQMESDTKLSDAELAQIAAEAETHTNGTHG